VSWQSHAVDATRRAAKLRAKLDYGPADAVSPIDIALKLNLDVWFRADPSLEGMYSPGTPPAVIINSLRPAGRRHYTAGHEVGHHVYGHGFSLDAQIGDRTETRLEEFIANRFARALLMPKLAVANAFVRRAWSPRATTAEQLFVVAQDLGVGFTALIDQMSRTLGLLDAQTAATLRRRPLPKIRAELLGAEEQHDVFVVNREWGVRPVDLEVGDVVVAPADVSFHGRCMKTEGETLRAAAPGVPGRIVHGG